LPILFVTFQLIISELMRVLSITNSLL